MSVINGTKLVATVSLGAGSRPFYATYDESNGFVYLSNTADGVHSGTVGVVNGTDAGRFDSRRGRSCLFRFR